MCGHGKKMKQYIQSTFSFASGDNDKACIESPSALWQDDEREELQLQNP